MTTHLKDLLGFNLMGNILGGDVDKILIIVGLILPMPILSIFNIGTLLVVKDLDTHVVWIRFIKVEKDYGSK